MGDFFMDKNILTGNKRKYVIIFAVIFGVYLFMKYLSPVLSPFLLAFFMAGALSRLANKIPIKIKKPVLAGIILLLFGVILIVLIGSAGAWIFKKGGELAGQVEVLENEMYMVLTDCCDRLEGRFDIDGDEIEEFVLRQVNLFAENMEVNVLPVVMNKSMGYMRSVAGIATYFVITIIAVFLMLKDYEKLVRWMLENKDLDGIWEIAGKVIRYIKTYIRAQGMILIIISVLCAVVLCLLGMEGGLLYGLLTGVMDLLPFIGTGIMLVPLSVLQFLNGNYFKAVAVLCLYGVCALIREVLEPKLIGNKVGIWPVGILLAVFAGVQLFGIFGIIKGPIGFVIICETCRYFYEKEKQSQESVKEEV